MKAATERQHICRQQSIISIHAAREGGDSGKPPHEGFLRISIHAAREGGDAEAQAYVPPNMIFQSTPPVKAATVREGVITLGVAISIHAAREGGDYWTRRTKTMSKNFNPRRP